MDQQILKSFSFHLELQYIINFLAANNLKSKINRVFILNNTNVIDELLIKLVGFCSVYK